MRNCEKSAQSEFQRAKNYAVKALARSEHTRRGLAEKMRKRKFSEKVIYETLNLLEKEGAVDDRRYAGIYLKKIASTKGYAPARLRRELVRRGISPELATALTECIDEDEELSVLKRAVERRKKIIGKPDTPKTRAKWISYLKRLGFRPIMIKYALKMAENQ